jgi:SAM-dependent methyltransferase
MPMTDEVTQLLDKPEFPRSKGYDAEWMLDNQMGPNAVWLMEWLCEGLSLEKGQRVLDLGCGKAMTSVFLAKELGVSVHAADLWMSPDHNWRRVVEAGVGGQVCPLKAEAHTLPFAEGYFDAVLSVDAYQYFGIDELYLGYLSRFVRPGGQIGIVVPGLTSDFGDRVPEHLLEPQSNGKHFWADECWSFRSAEAWHRLWLRSGRVTDVQVDVQPDGWRHWMDFERAVELAGKGQFPSDAEALERDAGRHIGFVRALATRTQAPAENLYEPGLGAKFGVDT